MEVEVIVALETKVTDGTNERFFVEMGLQVALDVRLSWKSFTADVTVERLHFAMKSFMEAPQSLDFEVFLTESTLERPINRMCHQVTV